MKNKARVTKSNKFLYLLVFAAVFVAGVFFASNKISTRQLTNGNLPTTSPEVRAKLAMVKYSLSKTGINNVVVSSTNYGFEMIFPDHYKFDIGRGFNKDYPENETVSIHTLGIEKIDVNNDLVYAVNIGFINGKTLEQRVDEAVYGQKRNTKPWLKPEEVEKVDIKLRKTALVINGVTAIKIQFQGSFGGDQVVYYLVKGDKYYQISAGKNHGKLFTTNQLSEIDRVIRSFKFI